MPLFYSDTAPTVLFFSALIVLFIRAECPPYGQVPAYRKPVSRYLASFELSAQVATEAGCYNDGRV